MTETDDEICFYFAKGLYNLSKERLKHEENNIKKLSFQFQHIYEIKKITYKCPNLNSKNLSLKDYYKNSEEVKYLTKKLIQSKKRKSRCLNEVKWFKNQYRKFSIIISKTPKT